MKKLIIISAILIWGFLGAKESFAHFGVSGYFYNNLSPYGTWIEIDNGVIVWRPTRAHLGWSPYQEGRWIWTGDGWYWHSYEPFGYITYHYGRWYFDDYYGWLWYPDYEWAPAWVEWRYDDDYIGWAPLSPYASFSISVGIFFTYTYYAPYYHWHFVSYRHFCNPYVYKYYVPPKQKYRIYSHTKYRTNYGYRNGRVQNRGVDVSYIRNRSGQDIRERDIVTVNDPRDLNVKQLDDNNKVRTFIASRDKLTRNERTDLKIQNDGRRTSLDISKVRIGDRTRENEITKNNVEVNRNLNRNEVNKELNIRNNQEIKRDVNKTRTENNRNEKIILQKDNRINNETKVNNNRNQFDQKKVKTEKNNVKKFNTNQNNKKEIRVNTSKKNFEFNNNNNRSNDDQRKNVEVNRNLNNNNRNTVIKQNRQETKQTGRTNSNNVNTRKRK
jgi:hypothetical protein